MQPFFLIKRILFLPLCYLILTTASASAAVPADFTQLVKAAGPAVVNISTERIKKTSERRLPPGFHMFKQDPFMERFFEQFKEGQIPQQQKRSSLGSGFIISSDGYIVTNNHVIEDAAVIRIIMDEKNKEITYQAEIIGTDPDTDLALLKINAENLPSLSFGNSNELSVGEWVLAIGNPLGLDHTVTAGIVSAKGRNIQSGSYDDFLQTDASINPGNSGGPLLNMSGQVVGINTAIAQRAQGIGFAIPSSLAQKIITDLKEHRKVSRGWLGVTIQKVDTATAKALSMKEAHGALIGDVLEGQPADKAGVKPGDVIIALNGERVENADQLLRTVALLTPGKSATAIIWREGKEIEMTIFVSERESTKTEKFETNSLAKSLGITARPITPAEIDRYKLSIKFGLLVTAVHAEGLAASVNIATGDVIVTINKKPATDTSVLEKAAAEAVVSKSVILLHIFRNGSYFFKAIDMTATK